MASDMLEICVISNEGYFTLYMIRRWFFIHMKLVEICLKCIYMKIISTRSTWWQCPQQHPRGGNVLDIATKFTVRFEHEFF